jgi:5-formyltetrahydrofolate cyclo-ligase
LPQARRDEAARQLITHLPPLLASYSFVLSFASFKSEIDTSGLNYFLADEGQLLLPKIVGNDLKLFHVTSPSTQLIATPYGLNQPNPKLCEEVLLPSSAIVLVPALGFDRNNHRLGYGKGYYDRFLKKMAQVATLGIGFKEQFVSCFPVTTHDFPLEKVSLF